MKVFDTRKQSIAWMETHFRWKIKWRFWARYELWVKRPLFEVFSLVLLGIPKVVITGPGRKKIPVEITDNDDGTFTCAYTPEEAGRHTYDIEYAGENVPESPFKVQVKPSADADKVTVNGLEPGEVINVGKEHDFDIDAVKTGKGSCSK